MSLLRACLGVCAGLLLLIVLSGWTSTTPRSSANEFEVCTVSDPDPPEYYQIDLVPTGRIPGIKIARGTVALTFATSPFGVALAPDGSYLYNLHFQIDQLRPAPEGVYVAWVSTRDLDEVIRLGPLDENHAITGQVAWNKFLVIVTLEPSAEALGDRWTGPVVLRGMSRSGMMHTMAGHGPFQQEPCAVYGY